MTDASDIDGTVALDANDDLTLGGLLAGLAVDEFDYVRAADKATLDAEYHPTSGRLAITASDTVFVGTGDSWVAVGTGVAVRDVGFASDAGTVTLSSGTATVDTGITSTSAVIEAAAAPVDPNADAKVETSIFWDDSAGAYKVEIDEVDTAVGSFDANYRWRQVSE